MRSQSIASLGRSGRLMVFGVLVFLGSLLLGSTYFPTINYFWGIGVGRVLLALLLLFVPDTAAGRYRPFLLLCLLGTLIFSFTSLSASTWIPVTFVYLLLEISADSLIIQNATEEEVPLELGFLAASRVFGLWSGLLLQYGNFGLPFSREQLTQAVLFMLFLYWTATPEQPTDKFFPKTLRPSKLPVKIVLADAFHYLGKPRALAASAHLLVFSFLAGLTAGAVLPYPLLHPSQAGEWLASLLPNATLLGVGLALVWLTEKLRLGYQLPVAALLTLGLIGYRAFKGEAALPEFSAGLLLAGILLSCRAVLRETYRLNPILRAGAVVTLWTFGSLLGAVFVEGQYPNLQLPLQLLCGLASLIFGLVSISHYLLPPVEVGNLKVPSQASERFGDRNHDFENAPPPERRKRRVPWKVQAFFNFFLVNIPVTILLASTLAAALSFGWFMVERRVSFEHRVQTAFKVFRTQLFLTGFQRRLTQEMVGSERVPEDWNAFISESFTSDGKALSDTDLWGTPYQILNHEKEVVITSAGPDKKFGSSDDLTQSVKKPQGLKN